VVGPSCARSEFWRFAVRSTASPQLLTTPAVLLALPGAGGLTADELGNAGWGCHIAGPHRWTHCDKAKEGARSTTVRVFSTDGQTFLGTEQLLHDDVYADRPCPQDDQNPGTGFGAHWVDLSGPPPLPGIPYWACHHFDAIAASAPG
jgi:hypothetical protein